MPDFPVPDRYVRPDPEPSPSLPGLAKSAVCTLNDGTQHRFPSLGDYLDHYISQGIVENGDDLVSNYGHLIGEIFFNWISTGQLGCLFAVQLAKKPRENGWYPIVQLRSLDEGINIAPSLNLLLDTASESHEAAAVIFPDVVTPEQIVLLVNALCADPSGRWYRTEAEIATDPSGNVSYIGLRWILKGGQAVNYVLGFCNIDTMPQTKRSPFAALFLRIRETKRTPAHKEDGRVQVHLADLDSTFHQETHDQVWELTRKKRANHVEPHMTTAARARITFSLSSELVHTLCAAREVVIEKDPSNP